MAATDIDEHGAGHLHELAVALGQMLTAISMTGENPALAASVSKLSGACGRQLAQLGLGDGPAGQAIVNFVTAVVLSALVSAEHVRGAMATAVAAARAAAEPTTRKGEAR